MRKEDEVKRTLEAFESAVEYADKLDGVIRNGNGGNAQEQPKSTFPAEPAKKRMPRPSIPVRPSIQHYSLHELTQLIRWLCSDGRLRTDEEIVTEMVSVLGFSRRGARIESAIKNALYFYRNPPIN